MLTCFSWYCGHFSFNDRLKCISCFQYRSPVMILLKKIKILYLRFSLKFYIFDRGYKVNDANKNPLLWPCGYDCRCSSLLCDIVDLLISIDKLRYSYRLTNRETKVVLLVHIFKLDIFFWLWLFLNKMIFFFSKFVLNFAVVQNVTIFFCETHRRIRSWTVLVHLFSTASFNCFSTII